MIVLDTHAWIWWISDPAQLSKTARKSVEEAAGRNALFVSSMSVLEVSLLVTRKRLDLSMDLETWLKRSEALPQCAFISVDNEIAYQSAALEGFEHHDPIDRLIMATALSLGMPLVTKDRRIRNYKPVRTIW